MGFKKLLLLWRALPPQDLVPMGKPVETLNDDPVRASQGAIYIHMCTRHDTQGEGGGVCNQEASRACGWAHR